MVLVTSFACILLDIALFSFPPSSSCPTYSLFLNLSFHPHLRSFLHFHHLALLRYPIPGFAFFLMFLMFIFLLLSLQPISFCHPFILFIHSNTNTDPVRALSPQFKSEVKEKSQLLHKYLFDFAEH